MLDSNFRHIREQGWNLYMESGVETMISDLMVVVSDVAFPVSEVEWDTNLLTTQKVAAAAFLGASNDQVRTADIGHRIGIATCGIHRYDCDEIGTESDRAVGDYVSFAENDAGDGLEPQKVVVTDDVLAAIGRVVEASTGIEVVIRLFGLTTSL